MEDEIDEPIEGGKDSPLENTSSDINTESPQSPPPPEPPNDNHYESKQPRSQHFEATVEKATNLGKEKEYPKTTERYKKTPDDIRLEEERDAYAKHRIAEAEQRVRDRKKKRDEEEPDAYMSEVYRKRAEKEQKEKTTADIYASQDKEMAESFFGGRTKAQVEAEMPAGSRGKFGTVGTKSLDVVQAETIAFNTKKSTPVRESQHREQIVRDEETRQSHVPIKSSSFEDTIVKAKRFGKTGNTTDFASTAQTTTQVPKREPAQQPFTSSDPFTEMNRDTEYGYGRPKPAEKPHSQYTGAYQNKSSNADLFDQMNKDTEKQNTSGIDFDEVSKSNELAAKKKQIADYQKTQPSMDAEIEAKRKENRDKKTLEDYKNNRGAVGKAMDMFSRTHTQEMGYAAEKKVEGYLTKRREEKKLENKKRIEPLRIQNDQNLKEGKINKEMHAVREKQYLEKMEDITPLEEKIGKGVKREANSAFGILNEAMTSPEGRKKINEQRVKEGKAPLQSAMDDNSIAATFARGVASTSKQLHTKPAKSQPAIFTRGTEAPKFSGAAMHSLPTSSSFLGVGVGIVAAPRKGKGSRSAVSQKGGNPINFGGVGGGGFGGGGAPISFGSGFGLFGRGQPAPAPAPAPVKRKKR